MGIEGYAGWYQDSQDSHQLDSARIVEAVGRVFRCQLFSQCIQSTRPDSSWFEAKYFDPSLMPGAVVFDSVIICPMGDPGVKSLGQQLSAEQFVAACGENHYVGGFVQLHEDGPVGIETTEVIPETIRGQWQASAPYLRVGEHDLFVSHPEVRLIARASFSIAFWDHDCPRDSIEFKRRFFSLPSVIKVRRDLEEELGPLHEFGTWG